MAHEILAKLGITTSQFESGINRAKAEVKEFAKEVKNKMGEAKEAIADIAKETGGGKLATMLGFAGGTAAVTAFGAAVVETMKGGIEEAGKFQTQAFEMGYA